MTQAGNLRNYGDDFATEPMTTRAVELGEILSFWDPDGVGHSPSGPNRPGVERAGRQIEIDTHATLERRGREEV